MLEVKTSLGGLEALVQRLHQWDKKELETVIANTIINEIQKQTANHLDVDGNPFKPYTAQYAKYGRTRKGYSTEVDLRRTGDLLNALVVEKQGVLTTVTVSDSEKDKAEGVSKLRKFIGISPKTRESIIDYVRQAVGKVVRG